jgi:peptidoglycan-N-acetylglucosamine deacetylase
VPPARILLWILSTGIVLLSLYGVVYEPLPLWIGLAATVFYASFLSLGVMLMRLEMFGDAVWVGDTDRQDVALTFDDGPNATSTPAVLDALLEAGVHATFFVIGQKAEQHPELLRRIVEEGHDVGLHSYQHERLYVFKTPRRVAEDIRRCQKLIEDICGKRPTLFRPPVGLMSPRVAAGVKTTGVTTVGWSARTHDGVAHTTREQWMKRALDGLDPGGILLLHDAAERDNFTPTSVGAIPELLREIRERGYSVVPLARLIEPETAR